MSGFLDDLEGLRELLRPAFDEMNDAPREQSGACWEGAIYGACPVQGQGSVDGLRWYFRSRGDSWRFGVGDTDEAAVDGSVFSVEKDYGVYPAAGWIKNSEAWEFIREGIQAFRESREGGAK